MSKQPTMTVENQGGFTATDLKDELRPPELFDHDEGWYVPEEERDLPDHWDEPLEPGMMPKPVLDPAHGPIRMPCSHVVQVHTDVDIYHELVEWLDEVFTVPRGYDVFWCDLSHDYGETTVEPHALIVMRDDDEVNEYDPDDPVPLQHLYQRGDFSGEIAHAEIHDGGIVVNDHVMKPTKAAEVSDCNVRGDAAREKGYNGWTWWEVATPLPFNLDFLR